MNLKSKKTAFLISLFLSFILHLAIIFIFGLIYFKNADHEELKRVSLYINQIEKKVITKKAESRPKKLKLLTPNIVIKEKIASIPELETNIIAEVPSENLEAILIDSVKYYTKLLDSLVLRLPNITTLKYVVSEKIKNDPKVETDSAFAVRRLRENVLDYYKNKYPTPLSKFGDQPKGIAIDKIIKMFSGEDEEETRKIKRYLELDTF